MDFRKEFEQECCFKHYSKNTIDVYRAWGNDFYKYHSGINPQFDITQTESHHVVDYLKHITTDRKLSAASHNQAFMALLFIIKHVLKKEVKFNEKMTAKKRQYIPDVLSMDEVFRIIDTLYGVPQLVISLAYGSALRISDALGIRINQLDFDNNLIIIRGSKGDKDRTVPMPEYLKEDLKKQVQKATERYKYNMHKKFKGAILPQPVENKTPGAAYELKWQYIFPSPNLIKDIRKQYHIHESTINKALAAAVKELQITKHVTAHTFRRSCATHLYLSGYDLQSIKELLGHNSIRTTEIYLHCARLLREQKTMIKSPLDNRAPKETIYKPKLYSLTS